MLEGGRAALYRTVQHYIDLERESRRSGELHGVPLLFVGLVALGACFFDVSNKPVLAAFGALFLISPWIARWSTLRTNRRLEAGLDDLKAYVRNVIFEYEVWLDLMSDEPYSDVNLGPVGLGRRQVSFEQRISELFEIYPKLAEKKSLQPFPSWYRKIYSGRSQRSQERYVNNYWKYALALVLTDEFFGEPGI